MFFDYVKVSLVSSDSRKVRRATLGNFSFIGRRFMSAWVLYLLVGALYLALGAAYLAVAKTLPKSPLSFALLLFFFQQGYVLARGWISVLCFSTEFHFLRAHRALPSGGGEAAGQAAEIAPPRSHDKERAQATF
jgi:hypothetical protein